MLKSLRITNYTLIDSLSVNWDPHFNIITGETGAGKSILLGAISLVLGNRADLKMFKDKEDKCLVEAVFDISRYELTSFFERNDLDYHDTTYLRREITSSGRSRSFINDTPVTLQNLKELCEQLIHLHTQYATLELMSKEFALLSLDSFASIDISGYRDKFKSWQNNSKQLELLKEKTRKLLAEEDYLRFLFNELKEINLEDLAQEAMENEINTIEHAEEIKRKAIEITSLIENEENNALDRLNHAAMLVSEIRKMDPEFDEVRKRMDSIIIDLQDISREVDSLQDKVSFDPIRLQELQEQLDKLYSLQKKHHAGTVEALVEKRDETQKHLENIEHSDEKNKELENIIQKQYTELKEMAEVIIGRRKESCEVFEKTIEKLLMKLGMPHASFKIQIEKLKDLNEYGNCQVGFLFNANKGGRLQNVSDIASGGELSRLMLAIKSTLAEKVILPTLIFDEIDTGISGEIAIRMGEVLKEFSRDHQLICITHLPQIAAKADAHYYIFKEIKDGQSQTRLKTLKEKERIEVLAEMIGGKKAGEEAREQAKKLIV